MGNEQTDVTVVASTAQDTQLGLASKMSKGIQQGVHLPLPWLIAIVTGLIFNTGVAWAQFQSLKDGQASALVKLAEMSAYIVEDKLEHNGYSVELKDHEDRLRYIERNAPRPREPQSNTQYMDRGK